MTLTQVSLFILKFNRGIHKHCLLKNMSIKYKCYLVNWTCFIFLFNHAIECAEITTRVIILANTKHPTLYETGKNVAQHKFAINYPSDNLGFTASLAVDGDTRSTLNGPSITCSHTSQGNIADPAWWRVDLLVSYRIVGIQIYNRDKTG